MTSFHNQMTKEGMSSPGASKESGRNRNWKAMPDYELRIF